MFHDNWKYSQNGNLSALAFAYCIQVIPELSIGATLNIWDNDITTNNWTQNYQRKAIQNSGKIAYQLTKREEFVLKGINANLGMLWRINEK